MATTIVSPRLDVADLLGGSKVLGRLKEPADMQHAIREGLPYASLQTLETLLKLTQREVSDVLGMAGRTLARRKGQQLSPVESDRLYRLARVTQLAAETLGSLDKARLWLGRENRALSSQTPLALLDTEIGARQVEEALMRINYGMYA